MAREQLVTRTIKTTIATIMCLDTENAEVCNRQVALQGVFKNEKDLMKAVKKLVTDVEAVKVVNVDVEEKLYGMTEATFVANAKELPPRNA